MNDDTTLDSYYVTIRSANNDYRRVERFSAEDFCHAFEQAEQSVNLVENDEQIIQIERDYKV